MNNAVAVMKTKTSILSAVEETIILAGGLELKPNQKILIKPNLCSIAPPESGVTTDVRVVDGVVRYLKRHEPSLDIAIIESDSDRSADEAFRRLGFSSLASEHGVRLVNLSKQRHVMLAVEGSKVISHLQVPEILLDANHLVSVAKLKTHAFERYSGVWKNQFGLMKKSRRPKVHPVLSKVLFDLNAIFRPDLSIIDGIVALDGPGPLDGVPRKLGIIIAGRNPLSTDIVGCSIIGFAPYKVPHIKYALDHGLADSAKIVVAGDYKEFDEPITRFDFIPWLSFKLYRASLLAGRAAWYCRNFSDLLFISAYAQRSFGFSKLASGGLLSLRSVFRESREIIAKGFDPHDL